MTSQWTREAVAGIAASLIPSAPRIDHNAISPILPGFDLWDYWPVQHRNGQTAVINGGVLQMLLAAPVGDDPDDRHALARIRLMHDTAEGWRDLGNLLPESLSPGSRLWSGSAIVDDDGKSVTLYFTAAGRRSERALSFDQRLFETRATITIEAGRVALGSWETPVESVVADGEIYARDMAGGGAIGTIKAFRDPAWFQDPADGAEYLLFAGSIADSVSPWNGAVGVARKVEQRWQLELPLISADGVNNELERPHMLCHGGQYHCFWSTQRKVFAADGPIGPTGLYGMVADRFAGPWRPLNGTGLVFANPSDAPIQAFSWLVLADLSVLSFIDRPGLSAEPDSVSVARRHFGGTPAPHLQLVLDQDRAMLT